MLYAKNESEIFPPKATIIPDTTRIHNYKLIDNYSWIEDKTRSEKVVQSYISAENNFTEKILPSQNKIEEKLYHEFVNRITEEEKSVPVKIDNYEYYSRREEGNQYSYYCRKKNIENSEEEIYLDENKLAEGYKFFSISSMRISPNHKYLAFSIDTAGSEKYHLVIKDLESGKLLADTIENVSDITWANDNKTIFYAVDDEAGRTHKIFRHILGSDVEEDKLIFTEPDERYWCWISKTRNDKFLMIGSASKKTTEYRFLSADNPNGEFKIIEPRKEGHEYYVLSRNDEFYIITNDNAENNKLMKTSIKMPSIQNWQEVIATRDSVLLHADISKNFLIIFERYNGLEHLKIINLKNQKEYYVEFPEPIYSFYTWSSTEFDSDLLRITYESLITPSITYDFNMNTQEKTILKQKEIVGGYDKSNYQVERLFAKSKDNVEIPISLVYRKDKFEQNGESPLYLNAYGAYGDNFDVYFSSSRLSILDRGIVYAVAHVRGGQELGAEWYDQGKMFNKRNTFEDFISCAEFLKNQNYCGKIVAEGGSAGGLLMGAIANMRPELFHGIIADVPFVDIINTMMDPTLSAVVSEYEEWGNPNIKEQFDYMYSYAPYENVVAQDYPNMLVLGGYYDTRVNYWEPAKWVAKLRATKTDDNLLLLKTNMNAGHGGSSGRYDFLHEIAYTYSFMLKILNIEE